jgi:uncharacterized cupredoxin-like copper-binding protein
MTQMTEFKIGLSQQGFTPGAYTFVATNSGKVVHALEVDGPGVEDQKTAVLQPGQSANLNVNLQKGTYQVYCPVDGHKSLGMTTSITVG